MALGATEVLVYIYKGWDIKHVSIYIKKILNFYSMIAEIGGYSGLLIGFSMLDLALLFQKLLRVE